MEAGGGRRRLGLRQALLILRRSLLPRPAGGKAAAMATKRKGGVGGNKFRITLGLPVAATMNCADNSGAKNLVRRLRWAGCGRRGA